jgi:hypothetical protein
VFACADPVDPTPSAPVQVVAHLVLDLGAGDQFLLLERTERDQNGFIGVYQAQVSLGSPNGNTTMGTPEPADAGPAVYRLRPTLLLPRGTYLLRVTTPQGDVITGTTTVPDVAPVAGTTLMGQFRRATDTLRMEWRRVPGARSYQVSVSDGDRVDGGQSFHYLVFADTSISIPGTLRSIDNDPVFPLGKRVRVVVAAVDDNYYTYYHAQVDPFAGAPPSRLTGALGVFGSVVPIISRQYDVR